MRNYWNFALALSILTHTFLLAGLPSLGKFPSIKEDKEIQEMEVICEDKDTPIKQDDDLVVQPPLPYIEDVIKNFDVIEQNHLSLASPKIMREDLKEIILSEIPQHENLKKLPAYMDYYRLIRERIRKNAYRHYRSSDLGEVFLSFVILKDGRLENAYLNEESVKNKSLRRIALKSIEEAAPFPSFPEELNNYAYLQFNLSIYFKSN